MSSMNFLERLLDEGAVEWKPLGEIGQVRMCKRILKSQTSSEGDIPFYKIGTFGKEPDAYISKSLFEEYKLKYSYPKIGEILISASGTIGRTVIFNGEDSYFQDSNIVWIENNESLVLNKFLFYFYQIANWGISVGGTISRLYNDDLRKLLIPIPCPENPDRSLTIQAEIVRILDTFTALTAELTAELSDRQKQYEYYRDRLLTFEEGEVEWKPLGETVKIQRGRRLVKSELEEVGKYAVFQNCMTPLGYYHESNVKSDTTFIISAGAAGEIGYSDVDFWAADDVYYFLTTENLKSKFLYYFLLTQQTKISGQVRRASVPRLSKTTFEKIQIPVPPLEKQARIVTILDKFDTLTTSIREGLPREIALRQQQYEYYRDLLLSFPKAED